MKVDNLNLILPFLNFYSEDDFYYLQILQRKKENPQLGSNSRVIKNYYIRSQEYLLKHYEEIKTLCEVFNARASIRLNKRSYYKTGFKALNNMANNMSNKDFLNLTKSYDKACGQGHNDKDKKWILDIDDVKIPSPIMMASIEIDYNGRIYEVIPSATGFHIITNPFRLDLFAKQFPKIEVHKDNPTNLYIP